MEWHFINWVVIVLYFIGIITIGTFFSKRQKSSRDYFTAGGRVPTFVAACSIYATMLSSLSYIAIPAVVYRTNWTNGIAPLGIILLAVTVAYIFVPFIRRLNVTTAYEYLEIRFDRGLRTISAVTFILFHIIRIAVVIYLPTLALMTALPGINPTWLALITALFCVAYTSAGGIEAVVWSDFIQTIVLLCGAIAVIWFGFSAIPGNIWDAFHILNGDEKMFPPETLQWNLSTSTIWVVLIGAYFNSIYNYIGSQDVVQRYTTVKNLKEAQKSLLMNIPLLLMSVILFIGMGSSIYLYYKFNGPAPELSRPDAILPFMVITAMPPVFSGLVIAAILAAAQSTISSSLNSVATCIVSDLIAPNKELNDYQKLTLGKYSSWIIGIIGTYFALVFLNAGQNNMFLYIQTITAMLGGPIATVFLIGIFFKRAGSTAAWIGFLTSVVLSLLLTNPLGIINVFNASYSTPKLYAFSLPIIIIGGGLLAGFIASFIPSQISEEHITPLTIEGLKDISDIN